MAESVADSLILNQGKDIRVHLVHSVSARHVVQDTLMVPVGTTVVQALRLSRLSQLPQVRQWLDAPHNELACVIWARKSTPEQLLRDNDRIELCRPLKVDPKVARRERFVSQGARTAGLFARRRQGAKSGY